MTWKFHELEFKKKKSRLDIKLWKYRYRCEFRNIPEKNDVKRGWRDSSWVFTRLSSLKYFTQTLLIRMFQRTSSYIPCIHKSMYEFFLYHSTYKSQTVHNILKWIYQMKMHTNNANKSLTPRFTLFTGWILSDNSNATTLFRPH